MTPSSVRYLPYRARPARPGLVAHGSQRQEGRSPWSTWCGAGRGRGRAAERLSRSATWPRSTRPWAGRYASARTPTVAAAARWSRAGPVRATGSGAPRPGPPGVAGLADAGDGGPESHRSWWETRPEANVILVTGRVFDVLDVPPTAGTAALADGGDRGAVGPVAVLDQDRMLFFVVTRGSPADEDEWWSCGLDCEPESVVQGLRWHCRDSYVLAAVGLRGRPGRALAPLAAGRAPAAGRGAPAGAPGRRLRVSK